MLKNFSSRKLSMQQSKPTLKAVNFEGIRGAQTGQKVESLNKTFSERKDLITVLNNLEDMTINHLIQHNISDLDSIS
jgi:hypothetical protein